MMNTCSVCRPPNNLGQQSKNARCRRIKTGSHKSLQLLKQETSVSSNNGGPCDPTKTHENIWYIDGPVNNSYTNDELSTKGGKNKLRGTTRRLQWGSEKTLPQSESSRILVHVKRHFEIWVHRRLEDVQSMDYLNQFGEDVCHLLQQLKERCAESDFDPSDDLFPLLPTDNTAFLQNRCNFDNYDHENSRILYTTNGKHNYNPNKYTSLKSRKLCDSENNLMWELISSPRKYKQLKPLCVPCLDLAWVDED